MAGTPFTNRLRSMEYWLENLVFPVVTAVTVGLILRWAAVDVAADTLTQGQASATRNAVATDLANAQAGCRSLVNAVSYKNHSLDDLVAIRDDSFANINRAALNSAALLPDATQASFRAEVVAGFVDCSNLVIAAKNDAALESKLDSGRLAVWNAIQEGSNWWSAQLLDPGFATVPPLEQRGYSEASLRWWQDYAAWKNAGGTDLASFPGL